MTAQKPESERHLPLKQHQTNKQTNKSPDDSTETWVWTPSTTQTTQNKKINKQNPRWQHRNLSLNAIYHSNNTKQKNKQTKPPMTALKPESERHLPLKQHKTNKNIDRYSKTDRYSE